MRRLSIALISAASLIAFAQIATAADMPVKAPPPAVAPAPIYNWTGFYLGGYFGNSINQATASTPGLGNVGDVGINSYGWTGGATAGYNWQFAPAWLVGIEGDFGFLGGRRLFREFDDNIAVGEKNTWYGTARGRFGYVTGPSLLYVTGGVGFVHVTDTFGPEPSPVESSTTAVGGTFGAGIETRLSRNWTTKTEYLYIDGGSSHTFPVLLYDTPNFSHNFQVIKTGLNYRFDGDWDGLPFFNAPMLPSNHNWNGFYVGGNAGIGSSLVQTHNTLHPAGDNDLNGEGFAGGGQIGYNYLLWQKYLLGAEADFGALDVKSAITDWEDLNTTFSEKTHWYATVRGRVGTTTGPALLYITGGAAWVNREAGIVPFPPIIGGLSTGTRAGWTFGGGTEVALDARWSARLESLYIDTGNSTHPFTPTIPVQFNERFVVVRAGLNYALN